LTLAGDRFLYYSTSSFAVLHVEKEMFLSKILLGLALFWGVERKGRGRIISFLTQETPRESYYPLPLIKSFV